MVFCRQKIPNKDLSWSKSEKVYTRLYLNKLESIMRALWDALPRGHRAMASIAFWLRKGHSAGKPLPQLAIREDANFFAQNWTKKLFIANKDPKTNFDAWMILQKPVLSFKCNDLLKMANLKAIWYSATLSGVTFQYDRTSPTLTYKGTNRFAILFCL